MAPLTPHPLAWDLHYGPALLQRGRTPWGRQPCCPHFSSATQVCGWCDYTLPSFGINQDLGISDLGGKLAARCLRSRSAWIVFCFRCCVADGKTVGVWRGPALGAGWQRLWPTPAAPTLSPSCVALSEQQKRPPGPVLLHNRDQTVWCKRRFAHLFLGGHCLLPVQSCQTLGQGARSHHLTLFYRNWNTRGFLPASCGTGGH